MRQIWPSTTVWSRQSAASPRLHSYHASNLHVMRVAGTEINNIVIIMSTKPSMNQHVWRSAAIRPTSKIFSLSMCYKIAKMKIIDSLNNFSPLEDKQSSSSALLQPYSFYFCVFSDGRHSLINIMQKRSKSSKFPQPNAIWINYKRNN